MAARRPQGGRGDGRGGHARLVPRRDAARRTEPGAPRAARLRAREVPVAVATASLGAAGRRAALILAGTGASWALLTWAGGAWGWPTRARALVDLFALAGFAWGLYMTWRATRLRRAERN